jgi:membrane-associated protease RseP (regulator of RpoE activity)
VLPLCKKLLLAVLEFALASAFALLLAWQALCVGVLQGLAACLLACVGGVLALFALIAAHELGHLLAAKATRLPFQQFTVGLVKIVRESGRFRIRLNTAWFQPAAFVRAGLPIDGDRRLRWSIFVMGGPLANLLIGLICLPIAEWHNPGPPPQFPTTGWRNVALLFPGDVGTALLGMTGVLSVGLCVVNLLPSGAARFRSDGGQLLDLWRHGRAHEWSSPA